MLKYDALKVEWMCFRNSVLPLLGRVDQNQKCLRLSLRIGKLSDLPSGLLKVPNWLGILFSQRGLSYAIKR